MGEISIGDRWPTEELVGRIHDGLQNRIDAWIRSEPFSRVSSFGSRASEPRISDGTRLTQVNTLGQSYAAISQTSRVILNDLSGELFVNNSDSLLVDPNSRLGTTGTAVTMPLIRIQRWLETLMPSSFNLIRHPGFLDGLSLDDNVLGTDFMTHRSNFDPVGSESVEPFSDFWAAVSGRGSWTRRFPRTIRAVGETGEEGQRARMIVIDDLTAEVYEHRSGSWQVVDDPTARPDTLEDEGLMRRFDYVGPWIFNEIARAMRETRAWEMRRVPVDPSSVVQRPGPFAGIFVDVVEGPRRSSTVDGAIDADEQQIYGQAIAALVDSQAAVTATAAEGGFEILPPATSLSSFYRVRRITSSFPPRTQATMDIRQVTLRMRPGFGGRPLDFCNLQVYRAVEPNRDFFAAGSFSGDQYHPVTLGTTDIPGMGESPQGGQAGGSGSTDSIACFFEFTDF